MLRVKRKNIMKVRTLFSLYIFNESFKIEELVDGKMKKPKREVLEEDDLLFISDNKEFIQEFK